ncbi:MAG TPA: hypothetical protein VER96_02380 [Polyangiaceae bacterium]|nr:hypothetical protein [Polyangiaceae bacterium]
MAAAWFGDSFGGTAAGGAAGAAGDGSDETGGASSGAAGVPVAGSCALAVLLSNRPITKLVETLFVREEREAGSVIRFRPP